MPFWSLFLLNRLPIASETLGTDWINGLTFGFWAVRKHIIALNAVFAVFSFPISPIREYDVNCALNIYRPLNNVHRE